MMPSFRSATLGVLATVLLSPGTFVLPLFAQHMNSPQAPCRKPATTFESTSCFAKAAREADEELNAVYMKTAAVLQDRRYDLANLRAAQRLWIRFRDDGCKAEHAMYKGGTAASEAKFACVEECLVSARQT